MEATSPFLATIKSFHDRLHPQTEHSEDRRTGSQGRTPPGPPRKSRQGQQRLRQDCPRCHVQRCQGQYFFAQESRLPAQSHLACSSASHQPSTPAPPRSSRELSSASSSSAISTGSASPVASLR